MTSIYRGSVHGIHPIWISSNNILNNLLVGDLYILSSFQLLEFLILNSLWVSANFNVSIPVYCLSIQHFSICDWGSIWESGTRGSCENGASVRNVVLTLWWVIKLKWIFSSHQNSKMEVIQTLSLLWWRKHNFSWLCFLSVILSFVSNLALSLWSMLCGICIYKMDIKPMQ